MVLMSQVAFYPVRATSDLLLIQRNMYTLKSGSLVMNPARQFATTPFVELGTEVSDLLSH